MNALDLSLIAVGLAMDACAVSVAAGASRKAVGPRAVFRISFHFGLFQFLMPVVGWWVGMGVDRFIQSFDHWVAFALLAYVGGRMVWDGSQKGTPSFSADPSRGLTLIRVVAQ